MRALELERETHLRVNSINPGRMRTAMRAAAYPAEDPNTLPSPADVTGAFLYLLSARGRGRSGELFDVQ
jgi:NAD(P)-dependent dehydrogenase (short-subunit alcohol dehydrogenase family)